MPKLISEANLRNQAEVLPFRWHCSACAEQFTIQNLPMAADDPRYAAEVETVQQNFAEHCKRQHASRGASPGASSGQ